MHYGCFVSSDALSGEKHHVLIMTQSISQITEPIHQSVFGCLYSKCTFYSMLIITGMASSTGRIFPHSVICFYDDPISMSMTFITVKEVLRF